MSNQDPRTYRLPSHVFVCQTRDCVVFLDARRDQYLGIGGPDADVLRSVLSTYGSREQDERDNESEVAHSSAVTQALDSLVTRGLLTLSPNSSRPFRQIDVQPAACAVGIGAEYDCAPRFNHVLVALTACVGAHIDLHLRGIGATVVRLIAEKQRPTRSKASTDPSELRRLLGVFRVIRPFLYAKKDRCLFHGLVVYRFLRHYGFSPTWVIGVSTAPFCAHCWVQDGERVLDDSPEQTLEFTPIAAI